MNNEYELLFHKITSHLVKTGVQMWINLYIVKPYLRNSQIRWTVYPKVLDRCLRKRHTGKPKFSCFSFLMLQSLFKSSYNASFVIMWLWIYWDGNCINLFNIILNICCVQRNYRSNSYSKFSLLKEIWVFTLFLKLFARLIGK